MDRFFFINFKCYPEAIGENAVSLAKKIGAVAAPKKSPVQITLVVSPLDVFHVSSKVSLKVFGQHFDPNPAGAFTGSVAVESLLSAGARGGILNHAEKKVSDEFVQKAVLHARELGFPVMLCAESVERGLFFAGLEPDFIAFELPELIGGAVSVSTARPDLVKGFIEKIGKKNGSCKLIVGAGIKTSLDVKKSIEFGADGVFVSSGVVKSPDPKKAVKELLTGFG
ncbi:MAG: triose-phosphate isomerase [archaeon]|nr:triose-phosphate isomerase [archaeon]